jgi:Uma2 family endonuclease
MTTTLLTPPTMTDPEPLLWTAEEYYLMGDMGLFQDRRVELIEGEIIQMPAQKNLHAIAISLTERALMAAFGLNFWVRVQASMDLSPFSVVDPDLAVVAGPIRSHDPSKNPTTALLIVEVSESTLRYDRKRKAKLYARAGIADYWIVNLVDRQLEVRRNPQPAGGQYDYADVAALSLTDSIAPLALPQTKIAVADMLP